MERAIVVRGRLSDERHVELAEPVSEISGDVEVVLRSIPGPRAGQHASILDLVAALPPGERTKEDIDRSLRAEREAWGDR
jgi:hypothetical protein